MRGAVFRELPPREQWEGGWEAGGRRPGPTRGGGGRRAGRRTTGLARGTRPRAEASSPEKTEVDAGGDPGGGGGGARAHPAGPRRARRPGVGSPLLCPAARPRPLSCAAAQVGAGRGAHVGKRAAGPERRAGSRGLAPSPRPLPGATRLLPTRGSGAAPAPRGSPPLPLARPPAAAWAAGIAAAALEEPAGAERSRGEPGVGGGRGGGRAPWEGERQRASKRGVCAQLERASEPARAAAGRTDPGPTAPGSRVAAARLAVCAALPRAPRTPLRASARARACVRVCECVRVSVAGGGARGRSPRAPGSVPGPRALTDRRAGSGGRTPSGPGAGARAGKPGPRFVRLHTGAGVCRGPRRWVCVGRERASARGAVQVDARCVRACVSAPGLLLCVSV